MDLNACWSFIFLGVCSTLIKRYQIKGVCYTLIKRWLVSLIFQVIPTLYLIQVTASSLPTVGMMSYINLMSSTTAPNQVKFAFNSLNSNFSLVKWPVPLECTLRRHHKFKVLEYASPSCRREIYGNPCHT